MYCSFDFLSILDVHRSREFFINSSPSRSYTKQNITGMFGWLNGRRLISIYIAGMVSEAGSSCSNYTKSWGVNVNLPPNCIGACNEFPSCAKQCVIDGFSNGNCTSMGHDPPCACCCM